MKRNRRVGVYKLGVVFAAMIVVMAVAYADRDPSPEIVVAHDLAGDGQMANQNRLPLLIMFSMDGCPYCDIVENEFLRPMLISGDYEDKVIIRMVKLDSYGTLTDFNGDPIDADQLAQRYSASLMPTVVFVDSDGREMAERLVGVTTVDYYGGDLDDRIDVALGRVRNVRLSANSHLNP